MGYEFSFYQEKDYEELLSLVLTSYDWEYPARGLSAFEFARGLHPAFTGFPRAWEHTVGIYRESGKIAACVWNEGNYDGDVFFYFDSKERAQEEPLLLDMMRFAKTNAAGIQEDRRTVFVNLVIPKWNEVLRRLAVEHGFIKGEWQEERLFLPFEGKPMEVCLPEGYSIIDGNTSPDFFLSNTHRLSFGYGRESYACEHGEQAFGDLRKMKYYKKNLDLCVIDKYKRPVAFAIIWYDEKMPYCELEPLGVVWWERRKGIGTAILHEAANRVMERYPNCIGMTGGDQAFYKKIGYEKREEYPSYHWETKVYISWEPESLDRDYSKEVE